MDLAELALVLAAIAAGAFVKGVTGMGLPLLGVPLLAGSLGVEHAVVIIIIPSLVTNTMLIRTYRTSIPHTRDLAPLLIGGALGAIAGTWLLVELDDQVLSLVLAAVIFGYVIVFLLNPSIEFRPQLTRYLSPPVGLGSGVLQGATGISAPVIATYLHGFRLEKTAYVFSITSFFLAVGLLQAASMVGLGLFTPTRLVQGLIALVTAVLVLPLGIRTTRRLSGRTFELVVLGVLVLVAIRLVFNALEGST
ncbi:MAG: TSUP family transporter [Acidimicrobiia bacterium]